MKKLNFFPFLLCFFLLLGHFPTFFGQEAPPKPPVPGTNPQNDVVQAMRNDKILSDLSISPPEGLLQVQFLPGTDARLGNELFPSKVRYAPRKLIWNARPEASYTIVFLDLDSPNRQTPIHRSMLNWMVVNVPGSEFAKGKTLVEYVGAAPAKDTGLHRMVMLAFEQSGKNLIPKSPSSPISARSIDGRFGFKLADFVKENNLKGPVAGNYFVSRYDNYVPILMGQLGLN